MPKSPPFLAMIIPFGNAYPDNTLPIPPGVPVYPDQGLPGPQPRPDHDLPPFPSHPIYFPPPGGQPPLGIWGPTDPRPTPPIVVPPGGAPPRPDQGLPGPQPRPDHDLPPFPSHPIVLPPNLPPTIPGEGGGPERKVEWKCGWTESTGWVVVGIPAEGTNVPTPSKRK